MSTDDTSTTAAAGPLLTEGLGPVARVQRIGSYRGMPVLGCVLSIEAEKRLKVTDPLYDLAAIDAAVAAERERCARVCEQLAADAYACLNGERVLVRAEPVGRDCAAAIRGA